MTNDVKAKYFINIAQNVKTRYAYGGWGEPLNAANKIMFLTNPDWKVNQTNQAIYDGIISAEPDMFGFDCNCLVKSGLDGFSADTTKQYGGAIYAKPCPDYTIQQMLDKECVDVSTDMTKLLICEYVVSKDKGHCGIYVGKINGKRMVVECTYNTSYNGKNGVQLIDMDCDARKNLWGYHGKLWNHMNYTYKADSLYDDADTPAPSPSPAPINIKNELQACIVGMANYLQKMQDLVSKL